MKARKDTGGLSYLHKSNARRQMARKAMTLKWKSEGGLWGYEIEEVFREQPGCRLDLTQKFAYVYLAGELSFATPERVESWVHDCIEEFGFLVFDGQYLSHPELNEKIADYYGVCEQNRQNGKLGGRPKKPPENRPETDRFSDETERIAGDSAGFDEKTEGFQKEPEGFEKKAGSLLSESDPNKTTTTTNISNLSNLGGAGGAPVEKFDLSPEERGSLISQLGRVMTVDAHVLESIGYYEIYCFKHYKTRNIQVQNPVDALFKWIARDKRERRNFFAEPAGKGGTPEKTEDPFETAFKKIRPGSKWHAQLPARIAAAVQAVGVSEFDKLWTGHTIDQKSDLRARFMRAYGDRSLSNGNLSTGASDA